VQPVESEKAVHFPVNTENTAQRKLDSLLNQIRDESHALHSEKNSKYQLSSETALRNLQKLEKEWRNERTRMDSNAGLQAVLDGLIHQVDTFHGDLHATQQEESKQLKTILLDALMQTEESVKCDAAVNAVETRKEAISIGVSTNAPIESVSTGTDPLSIPHPVSQSTDTKDLTPYRFVNPVSTQTVHRSLESVSTNTETVVVLRETLMTQTETPSTVSIGLNTIHSATADSDTQTPVAEPVQKMCVEVPWVTDRDGPIQPCGMVCSDTVEDLQKGEECKPVSEEEIRNLFEQDSLLRVLKARLATCEHELRWDFSLCCGRACCMCRKETHSLFLSIVKLESSCRNCSMP
jgi:hypothetical protein